MNAPNKSLEPIEGRARTGRRRLRLKDELALALVPATLVIVVLALIDALSTQRILFASLSSSAFLIYLDPQHGTNTVRTLTMSHLTAAVSGLIIDAILGNSYVAAGTAMAVTILLMIVLDVVHPPAVSTALTFAFRSENAQTLVLFLLSLLVIALLVVMQRAVVKLFTRFTAAHDTTRYDLGI